MPHPRTRHGRGSPHPRIRRRLRLIAVGLVLLPTLALAFLVELVVEAERDAGRRERRERRAALERRTQDLALQLGRLTDLFPAQNREYFALRRAAPPIELSGSPSMDASCSDWAAANPADSAACETGLAHFGRAELVDGSGPGYDPRDLSLSLLSGATQRDLYLFAQVFDDELRFGERRLDDGDGLHLLVSLPQGGALVPARFLLVPQPGPAGEVKTYQVDRSWSRQLSPEARLEWADAAAPPGRRPRGRWRATPDGYDIELRLPLASLGSRWREAELGLAVADVDGRAGQPGGLRRQTLWVLPQREGAFTLEAPDSGLFGRAWLEAGLNPRQRRLAVFDARGRELRASFAPSQETRDRVLALRDDFRREGLPGLGGDGLAAARVVSEGGQVLGLLVEEDATPVPRTRLGALVPATPVPAAILCAALALLFLLLAYTRRLSRRILALVADPGGDRAADDEIGELSRRLSDLIQRDRAQRDYLEQLPRVLAHETSNPLGVVKMFMDQLADAAPEQKRQRESARRAVHSIEGLIADLREATSLEEALERGERVEVDLAEHLADYASAYRDLNGVTLELALPARGVRSVVIEGRLEQLLDKLLDNAADFSDGSPLRIALETGEAEARIRVENHGPPLPEGPARELLFAPMRSGRKRGGERHLGLGLYVARVIAQHHGGGIRAWNAEGGRVVFEVTLPARAPQPATKRANASLPPRSIGSPCASSSASHSRSSRRR